MLDRSIEILLVEDNPGDVRLAREALTDGKLLNHLHVAEDGVAAMAFLRRQGQYARAARPDIIPLDLNLPKKDGREVLAAIKGDPNFRRIPVVVLASSQEEEDIIQAYDLHANSYIFKPVDIYQYKAVAESIEDFWFKAVTLPPD